MPVTAPHDERATTIREARYWLIYYEDADRPAEVYSDEGMARRVFENAQQAWNCTLFCEEAALAAARTDNERLRRQVEDIGPFFARDIARLVGLPDDAWMDGIYERVAALAASPGAEE